MPHIISVSRRTDIPAFYGKWFMNRIKQGFSGYIHPFGGQRHIVPLKPENVICFVFWSKNYIPFLSSLQFLSKKGYKFYFNFTLTGLPGKFEGNLCSTREAVATMKTLSEHYSPLHINWRYDPVIISDITPFDFHILNFSKLAVSLKGFVRRCYFSFAVQYGKVKKNFEIFMKKNNINIIDPGTEERQNLARRLSEIALENNIQMYTCCGDYLIDDRIKKARCIDGEIIEQLFYPGGFQFKQKPTRKECGCTESRDIGVYDTCPHGCVYCYANMNKEKARMSYKSHDPDAAFLGYSRKQSDEWIEEIKQREEAEHGLFSQ